MTEIDPIPEDHPRGTPCLHVDGASAAIDFSVVDGPGVGGADGLGIR